MLPLAVSGPLIIGVVVALAVWLMLVLLRLDGRENAREAREQAAGYTTPPAPLAPPAIPPGGGQSPPAAGPPDLPH
jgi:hypothetical protein